MTKDQSLEMQRNIATVRVQLSFFIAAPNKKRIKRQILQCDMLTFHIFKIMPLGIIYIPFYVPYGRRESGQAEKIGLFWSVFFGIHTCNFLLFRATR
jgi:hypothetical protein